jgi:pyruvate dehydrogenase E2 component (dihydrolipoamide acetyltransferase)
VSDFLMPALGADMEAGIMVEWLVKPGDRVKKGDVIAVVETEKGVIEVEIFDEGIVSEVVAPVGTRVAVGGLLAHIGVRAAAPPQKQAPVPLAHEVPVAQPKRGLRRRRSASWLCHEAKGSRQWRGVVRVNSALILLPLPAPASTEQ